MAAKTTYRFKYTIDTSRALEAAREQAAAELCTVAFAAEAWSREEAISMLRDDIASFQNEGCRLVGRPVVLK